MTIRPILRYPHPGLKTVCTPVTAFDDDLKTLAGDLLETMREAPGVGITAAVGPTPSWCRPDRPEAPA